MLHICNMKRRKSNSTGGDAENARGIPQNHIQLWRTGDNGEIARNETYNSIGKRTLGKTTDNGMWGDYIKTLGNRKIRFAIAFCIPLKDEKRNLATRRNFGGT